MGTIFTIAVLLAIVVFAIKSVIHRIKHGSACCGERDAPEKKSVTLLSKMELESSDLESEVREAGYTVLAITKEK